MEVGIYEMEVVGGEVYGQLLVKDVKIFVFIVGGFCRIEVKLCKENFVVIIGYDDILFVNLVFNMLDGKGVVWEDGSVLQNFLKGKMKEVVVVYEDNLGKLDWIMVVCFFRKDQLIMVLMEVLCFVDGKLGLDVVYYEDMEFQKEVYYEVVKVVNLSVIEGVILSFFVYMFDGYGIKWSGKVFFFVSGEYMIIFQSNDCSMIEVFVNGKKIYEIIRKKEYLGDGKVYLEGGKFVDIEICFRYFCSNVCCCLDWVVFNDKMLDVQCLMECVVNDGIKIFIIQSVDEWLEFIVVNSKVVFKDKFFVGINWLGGVMFNKLYDIFKEFFVGNVFNWFYQVLIYIGVECMGLVMEGEELLVGVYYIYFMVIGIVMGIVFMGKGSVLFFILDIYGNIINDLVVGFVVKKLIFNMIDFK